MNRAAVVLSVLALVLLPSVGFELMPQTDEGEVQVDVELPVGTRIERTELIALKTLDAIRAECGSASVDAPSAACSCPSRCVRSSPTERPDCSSFSSSDCALIGLLRG